MNQLLICFCSSPVDSASAIFSISCIHAMQQQWRKHRHHDLFINKPTK
jgi:hypothetical protein